MIKKGLNMNLNDTIDYVIESSVGLIAYRKTLDIYSVDVTTDEDYLVNFVTYYHINRDMNFMNQYLKLLEGCKNKKRLDLSKILTYLSNIVNRGTKTLKHRDGMVTRLELVNATRLLHTINQNYPIWNDDVANVLGVPLELKDDEPMDSRIREALLKYDVFSKRVKEMLKGEWKEVPAVFDARFPNYVDLTSVAKLHAIIWKKYEIFSKLKNIKVGRKWH